MIPLKIKPGNIICLDWTYYNEGKTKLFKNGFDVTSQKITIFLK